MLSSQVRRIEKSVACVGSASASIFVVREAESDESRTCGTDEFFSEIASGDGLGLRHASNHHDANGWLKVTNVSEELHHGLAAVHHRIYQYHCMLTLQMMASDVVGTFGMDERGLGEGVVDTKSQGFSAAHQRYDQRLVLM